MADRVNDIVKMILRGESPWGEIIDILPDGSAKIRIDSVLVNEWPEEARRKLFDKWPPTAMTHGYKENDVVLCRRHPEYGQWIPVADYNATRSEAPSPDSLKKV